MIRPIFLGNIQQNATNTNSKTETQNPPIKKGGLEIFYTKAKNLADLNDTIQVPRTIFKGYLAFFTSTTLLALSGLCKKSKSFSTGLNIASSILALYGTFAFVRPYLYRAQKPQSDK